MLVELVLRWIHILSAIILVGGTFFMRFSLSPTLQAQDEGTRNSLLGLWRPPWARWVMLTSGLLLVSGLVNAVRIIKAYQFPDAPYHALVALKLVLAFVIFWIIAVLARRSATAEKFRTQLTKWLTINVVLATITVLVAGYMKVTPHVPKVEVTATESPETGAN